MHPKKISTHKTYHIFTHFFLDLFVSRIDKNFRFLLGREVFAAKNPPPQKKNGKNECRKLMRVGFHILLLPLFFHAKQTQKKHERVNGVVIKIRIYKKHPHRIHGTTACLPANLPFISTIHAGKQYMIDGSYILWIYMIGYGCFTNFCSFQDPSPIGKWMHYKVTSR